DARPAPNASLDALVTHIVETHHAFTRGELERIEKLIAKVSAAHGARHPEIPEIGALFARLREDLDPHMLKEERVLFPFIVALERAATAGERPPTPHFGTVRNPVRVMASEHDAAGDLLVAIREAARGFVVP